MKAHQVLLTDDEWNAVYEVYPRDVPVIHPLLQEFAQLIAMSPQSIVEGTNQYRQIAEQCRCWFCEHMLSLPMITGFHLYITQLNRICAGGNPRCQLN